MLFTFKCISHPSPGPRDRIHLLDLYLYWDSTQIRLSHIGVDPGEYPEMAEVMEILELYGEGEDVTLESDLTEDGGPSVKYPSKRVKVGDICCAVLLL